MFLKMSNVQMPVPVISSGVRFAAKLTPQGPENAVFVGAPAQPHRSDVIPAALSIRNSWGWPDSARLMSGPNVPSGLTIQGV